MSGSPSSLERKLNTASGAALFTLIWDWAITFDDEVELIWLKSNTSWLKWIFIFTRYYVLSASLAARSIEAAVIFDLPVSRTCAKVWYACQVLVASHAMSALEIVLMIRVYALYNRQRRMAILFSVLLLLENGIVVIGILVNLPHGEFDPAELVAGLPPAFSYFGLSASVVQAVIMYFTLTKYLTAGWKAVPLVQLIFRDGTLAFTVISVVALVMAIATILGIPFVVSGYSWLLVAISALTCRIITNMQKLPLSTPNSYVNGSTGIQFTSIITSSDAEQSLGRTFPTHGRSLSTDYQSTRWESRKDRSSLQN